MTQPTPRWIGDEMARTTRSKAFTRDGFFRFADRKATGTERRSTAKRMSKVRRRRGTDRLPTALLQSHLAEEAELVEGAAGPQHDGELRVLGDHHRQARLLAEEHIEVLELGAAAREHDALVDDVGGELGRRALEDDAHGVDDCV